MFTSENFAGNDKDQITTKMAVKTEATPKAYWLRTVLGLVRILSRILKSIF